MRRTLFTAWAWGIVASMRFLLKRLDAWLHQVPGAQVKPKDPLEYLTRLKFHQRVASIADYGLDS